MYQAFAYMRGSATSIGDQQAALAEFFERDGRTPGDGRYFADEGVGGRTTATNRDAFRQMMHRLRRGDTVYVTDVTRISRDAAEFFRVAALLAEMGVHLHVESKAATFDLDEVTLNFVVSALGNFGLKPQHECD